MRTSIDSRKFIFTADFLLDGLNRGQLSRSGQFNPPSCLKNIKAYHRSSQCIDSMDVQQLFHCYLSPLKFQPLHAKPFLLRTLHPKKKQRQNIQLATYAIRTFSVLKDYLYSCFYYQYFKLKLTISFFSISILKYS